MDLLENYLNTIRWNLPHGAKAEDIMTELRDVIASRIEDREDALGRPLTKDETSAVLRDFGHPLVVATSYGAQQSLIGTEVFPFYWFSLKVVLAIHVAILLIQAAANAAFSNRHAMQVVMQGVSGGWWSLLATGGLVTLIFAVIERTGWLTEHLKIWSPEHLPDLPKMRGLKAKPKSAWESVFEIAVGIAVLSWWAGLLPVPVVFSNMQGLSIAPAPVWTYYYWPVFALLAGSLLFNILQLVRPRWRALHAALAVALAAGGVALLTLVYQSGDWLIVKSSTMSAADMADVQRSLHLSLRIAIVVVGLVWLAKAAKAVWRLYADRRG